MNNTNNYTNKSNLIYNPPHPSKTISNTTLTNNNINNNIKTTIKSSYSNNIYINNNSNYNNNSNNRKNNNYTNFSNTKQFLSPKDFRISTSLEKDNLSSNTKTNKINSERSMFKKVVISTFNNNTNINNNRNKSNINKRKDLEVNYKNKNFSELLITQSKSLSVEKNGEYDYSNDINNNNIGINIITDYRISDNNTSNNNKQIDKSRFNITDFNSTKIKTNNNNNSNYNKNKNTSNTNNLIDTNTDSKHTLTNINSLSSLIHKSKSLPYLENNENEKNNNNTNTNSNSNMIIEIDTIREINHSSNYNNIDINDNNSDSRKNSYNICNYDIRCNSSQLNKINSNSNYNNTVDDNTITDNNTNYKSSSKIRKNSNSNARLNNYKVQLNKKLDKYNNNGIMSSNMGNIGIISNIAVNSNFNISNNKKKAKTKLESISTYVSNISNNNSSTHKLALHSPKETRSSYNVNNSDMNSNSYLKASSNTNTHNLELLKNNTNNNSNKLRLSSEFNSKNNSIHNMNNANNINVNAYINNNKKNLSKSSITNINTTLKNNNNSNSTSKIKNIQFMNTTNNNSNSNKLKKKGISLNSLVKASSGSNINEVNDEKEIINNELNIQNSIGNDDINNMNKNNYKYPSFVNSKVDYSSYLKKLLQSQPKIKDHNNIINNRSTTKNKNKNSKNNNKESLLKKDTTIQYYSTQGDNNINKKNNNSNNISKKLLSSNSNYSSKNNINLKKISSNNINSNVIFSNTASPVGFISTSSNNKNRFKQENNPNIASNTNTISNTNNKFKNLNHFVNIFTNTSNQFTKEKIYDLVNNNMQKYYNYNMFFNINNTHNTNNIHTNSKSNTNNKNSKNIKNKSISKSKNKVNNSNDNNKTIESPNILSSNTLNNANSTNKEYINKLDYLKMSLNTRKKQSLLKFQPFTSKNTIIEGIKEITNNKNKILSNKLRMIIYKNWDNSNTSLSGITLYNESSNIVEVKGFKILSTDDKNITQDKDEETPFPKIYEFSFSNNVIKYVDLFNLNKEKAVRSLKILVNYNNTSNSSFIEQYSNDNLNKFVSCRIEIKEIYMKDNNNTNNIYKDINTNELKSNSLKDLISDSNQNNNQNNNLSQITNSTKKYSRMHTTGLENLINNKLNISNLSNLSNLNLINSTNTNNNLNININNTVTELNYKQNFKKEFNNNINSINNINNANNNDIRSRHRDLHILSKLNSSIQDSIFSSIKNNINNNNSIFTKNEAKNNNRKKLSIDSNKNTINNRKCDNKKEYKLLLFLESNWGDNNDFGIDSIRLFDDKYNEIISNSIKLKIKNEVDGSDNCCNNSKKYFVLESYAIIKNENNKDNNLNKDSDYYLKDIVTKEGEDCSLLELDKAENNNLDALSSRSFYKPSWAYPVNSLNIYYNYLNIKNTAFIEINYSSLNEAKYIRIINYSGKIKANKNTHNNVSNKNNESKKRQMTLKVNNTNNSIHNKINNIGTNEELHQDLQLQQQESINKLEKGVKLIKIKHYEIKNRTNSSSNINYTNNSSKLLISQYALIRKGTFLNINSSQIITLNNKFIDNNRQMEELKPFDEVVFPSKLKLDYLNNQSATPYLPTGMKLEINLLSNQGDKYYIGLNQIEIYDHIGNNIIEKLVDYYYSNNNTINNIYTNTTNITDHNDHFNNFSGVKIFAIPEGVFLLEGMEEDCRRITNIFYNNYNQSNKIIKNNNINNNCNSTKHKEKKRSKIISGKNTWLTSLISKNNTNNMNNKIILLFNFPISISCIKIWNYSKQPSRGVKEFQILLDDEIISSGFLSKAEENLFQSEDNFDFILFSGNKEFLYKIPFLESRLNALYEKESNSIGISKAKIEMNSSLSFSNKNSSNSKFFVNCNTNNTNIKEAISYRKEDGIDAYNTNCNSNYDYFVSNVSGNYVIGEYSLCNTIRKNLIDQNSKNEDCSILSKDSFDQIISKSLAKVNEIAGIINNITNPFINFKIGNDDFTITYGINNNKGIRDSKDNRDIEDSDNQSLCLINNEFFNLIENGKNNGTNTNALSIYETRYATLEKA